MAKAEKEFHIRAVVYGWLIDNVGSFIAINIVNVVAAITLFGVSSLTGKGAPQITPEQLEAAFMGNPLIMTIKIVLGTLFSIVGGYAAAYLANESEFKHAFAMGCLSWAVGIYIVAEELHSLPQWYVVLIFVLPVPAALIGGFIRYLTKKKKVEPPVI